VLNNKLTPNVFSFAHIHYKSRAHYVSGL